MATATSDRRSCAPMTTTTRLPPCSYLVGRIDRVVRRHIDDVVKAHGLSVNQYTTLSVLDRRSGLSNAQLARRALVSPQSMNEVLARRSSSAASCGGAPIPNTGGSSRRD